MTIAIIRNPQNHKSGEFIETPMEFLDMLINDELTGTFVLGEFALTLDKFLTEFVGKALDYSIFEDYCSYLLMP
jgi:hypothetical protein